MFCFLSADVVAFDFLGHGDSPAPNTPALYTANEVRYIISILYVVILTINTYNYTCIFDIHSRIPVFYIQKGKCPDPLRCFPFHSNATKLMLISVSIPFYILIQVSFFTVHSLKVLFMI